MVAGDTWYARAGYPANNSQGTSSTARAEFDRIQAAFGKLPSFAAGNAFKVLAFTSTGLAMEAVTSTGTGNIVRATDPTFTLTDVTTNNASTSQHGWMQKYPGGTTVFLRGDGSFSGVGQYSMAVVPRTSNTVIALADTGKFFELNGTFTQTFAAVATLGTGWYCYLKNSSTNDTDEITLDPSGAETIDGLASFKMYKGEVRLVYVNDTGTALKSIVLNAFDIIITATMVFTKPPGYSSFAGEMWCGGSSGQRTNDITLLSHGGGGGGAAPFLLKASALGATETITIGAGGAAVTTVANGNIGGNTSIGTLAVVYANSTFNIGGSVRTGAVTAAISTFHGIGFEGGRTAGGFDAINAVWGGGGSTSFNTVVVAGSSVWGGGSGGSCSTAAAVHAGGTSMFGGAGGASVSAGNGVSGTAPGGGGGATQTGTSSGAGARGEVRMHGVI